MHPQLRPPQDDDAAWLLEALNDARTNHALVDLPYPYPKQFMHEFWLDNAEPWLQFVWLKNQQAIGYIWFSVSDDNSNADQNAEMSFLLHPNFQSQGLGLAQLPNIFAWLAPHMQGNFKIANITSHTRPNNAAAQNILSACGFVLVDTANYPIPSVGGSAWLQQWQFDLSV
jgi:RimJ/RimL family protein N-acetyltransferase